MVCRDTEREAHEDYQRIIEMGDLEAANNLLKVLGIECGSHDETIRNAAQRFIAGWGGYPLIGTPETDRRRMPEDFGHWRRWHHLGLPRLL
jgi:FMNH2-dependent dimethyl sulfone monooxygenase